MSAQPQDSGPPSTLPHTSVDDFSFANLSLTDTLEDLASRFVLNIPEYERNSIERVGFQVEICHWYYEDFVREQNLDFPSCTLKKFYSLLWKAVPLLKDWHAVHEKAFEHFMEYKQFVPVCGAILLNRDLDKAVLVKGWKGSAGWGFPKGKINQTESLRQCAIREVYEETGFDIRGLINDNDHVSITHHSQVIQLYIVWPVPEDTSFVTRTRKEISRIEWFRLADLPGWFPKSKPVGNKFFHITPFMRDLRGWVGRKRRDLQVQAYESLTVDGTKPASVKKGKRSKKKPIVTVGSLVVQVPDNVVNMPGTKTITHESSASETEMETEDEEAENTDHGIDARLLSDAEVDATDYEEPENAVAILNQMSSAGPVTQSTMLVPRTFGETQNMRPLELTAGGWERDCLPNATPSLTVPSPVCTQSVAAGSRNQADSHVYNGSSRQATSRPAEAGNLPSPTRASHVTQPQPPLNPLQTLRRQSEYPPRPGSSASSQFCTSSTPSSAGAPGKEDTAARAKLLLDSIANDQSRSTPSSQHRSAVSTPLQMRPTFANVTPQPPAMPPQHAAPQSRPATINDPRFGPLGQIPMNGPRPNIPTLHPTQLGPPIPLNSHPGGPFPPIQRPIPVNAMPPYNNGSAPNSATDLNFTIRRTSLPFQDGPPFLPPPHGPPHGPLGPGHHLPPSMNGFHLPPQMLHAQFAPPPHPHSVPPPGNNNLSLPPPNPALLDALLDRTPRASHVNPPNPNTLPTQQGHTHLPIPQPQAQAPPRRVVPHAPQLLALFGGDAGSPLGGSGA